MENVRIIIGILALYLPYVYGEICHDYGTTYTYCDGDNYCCGNNKCCSYSVGIGVGAIVGIVFGCLAFIGCCILCVYCIKKKDHRPGLVIQPQSGLAVVSSGQQYTQPLSGQPVYGQPLSGQPVYGQPLTGQPVYGQPLTGQPVYGQPVYG